MLLHIGEQGLHDRPSVECLLVERSTRGRRDVADGLEEVQLAVENGVGRAVHLIRGHVVVGIVARDFGLDG